MNPAKPNLIGTPGRFWLLMGLSAGFFLAAADLGVLHLFSELIQGWDSNEGLFGILCLLFALGALRAFGQFIVRHSATAASEHIGADLRLRGLSLLLNEESEEKVSAGQLHHEINEIFPKTALYYRQLANCLGIGLHLCFLAALLFWVVPRAAAIGLLGLLLIFGLVLVMHKKTAQLAVAIPDAHRALSQGIDRVAKNWMLIRILRRGESEHAVLKEKVLEYSTKARAASVVIHLASSLPVILGLMVLCACLYLGLTVWSEATPTMLAFTYVFIRFVQGSAQLASSLGAAVALRPHVRLAQSRLSVLERSSPMERPPRKELNTQVPPAVVVSNLTFAYEGGPELFNGLDFTLRSGGLCAITGPSGSGKSTLLSLMAGLMSPDNGSILFRELSAADYMRCVEPGAAYVSAIPFLIEGTLRDNLIYGLKENANDSDLESALDGVQLYDRVFQAGKGLELQVGADGSPFSLGEQQRICLARAIVARPRILFLDEMTASLDSETQEKMIQLVRKIPFNCTILWATHHRDLGSEADVWVNLEKIPQKT
jgi:ABC-type multidrug transport system fused ATPase/permease subunit